MLHPAWLGRATKSGTGTNGANRHRALIAYLSSNNLTSTAAALRAEIGLAEDAFDAATAKKYEGLLEKKWTSVVRLQKKVGHTSHYPISMHFLLVRHSAPISAVFPLLTILVVDTGPRGSQWRPSSGAL